MYNERTWLNSKDSSFTGSIVCFDGETKQSYYTRFVEVSDCHSKIRLHQDLTGNYDDWVNKIKTMRDALNDYINYLEQK